MDRDELIARLMTLLDVPGIGPAGANRLLAAAGTVQALVQALDGDPVPSALAALPLFRRVRSTWAAALRDRQGKNAEQLAITADLGHTVVIRDDDDYPRNLHSVTTAPPLLYVRGSLKRLSERALALVGSVDPTARGIGRTQKMARLCTANGIQVISGLARGIDGASHRAALDSGAVTFAVVGHGLKHLYPPEHADLATEIAREGAVISQFAPNTPPSRWTFPARNELMCTLAQGTVIVEIERDQKLGSVIQARFSIKHGRPVFVLRSNLTEIKSEEARALVESGDAVEVRDFDDVLRRLSVSSDTFAPMSHSAELFDDTSKTSLVADDQAQQDQESSRAILFDLDGVVYDPRGVLTGAYQVAMGACGKEDVTAEDLASLLHLSPPKVYRHFGVTSDNANPPFNQEYNRLLSRLECIYEPVVEFLRRAREAGYRVGIVTSQPRNRCDRILKRAGIANEVDVSVSWNDVPRGQQKPNPTPLLKALERIGVSPECAVYVGDTPNDVLAARNARMRSVAVTWGLSTEDALRRFSPDCLASGFDELDDVLENATLWDRCAPRRGVSQPRHRREWPSPNQGPTQSTEAASRSDRSASGGA